jgi:Transposase DDE domain group 1
VVRTDSAGATHELINELRAVPIRFLMGFDLTEAIRRAILALPETAWRPAVRQDGETRGRLGRRAHRRPGPLELAGGLWSDRAPHPAQLSFSDHDGHRFLATLTDLPGEPVELGRVHRARASTEDRIRAAPQTGLENLPFRDFELNAVWLELSLIAQDVIAWTQALTLTGEHAVCEPEALRYRLLHTAGRLAVHARHATLRLQADCSWARVLAAAFTRLAALPPPAR